MGNIRREIEILTKTIIENNVRDLKNCNRNERCLSLACISRLYTTEEIISELEGIFIETSKIKKQKNPKTKNKGTNIQRLWYN